MFVTISNVNSLIPVGLQRQHRRVMYRFTVTVKLLVAVSCGLTKSYGLLLVTTVVNGYTPGTCPTTGVHRITPFVSIVDPAGPVNL